MRLAQAAGLRIARIVLAIVLGGAFLFVTGIKAREEPSLPLPPKAKVEEAPPVVDVVTVRSAPPPKSCAARRSEGLVSPPRSTLG